MSMYSKGPWHASGIQTKWGKHLVYDANNQLVADIAGYWRKEDAEREANTKLIAAAPEMIDALEMFVEEWSKRDGEVDIAFTMATSVLKRVKGE